jgi:hypothetical protein
MGYMLMAHRKLDRGRAKVLSQASVYLILCSRLVFEILGAVFFQFSLKAFESSQFLYWFRFTSHLQLLSVQIWTIKALFVFPNTNNRQSHPHSTP